MPPTPRLRSIDVLRGLVMVLMAIDHVRVYSGQPAGGPTAGIFFTRWVTHFCAPAFAFFAGTSAFLYGRRLGHTGALARALVTRGLVLVVLELTVIRVAWTFNVDFAHYLLAALVWLPMTAVAVFGLSVIVAQNLASLAAQMLPEWAASFLYFGGVFTLGADGPAVAVLYSIVPWIGVMAAGYAFGAIMIREPEERDRICLRIGLAATALFLAVGGIGVLVQPAGPGAPPALFRLLNQQKYPASQLFLLMTLGPTIALLPQAERARGVVGDVLAVFGRVPLFYYLLHIPLIHAAALVVSLAREGRVNPWLFGNHPMMPPPVPNGYRWSLPLLYLVFAIVVAILYVACRWFAQWKARRRGASHVMELSSAEPQPRAAQQL
jgi:uncharacterized membrane protein